MLSRQGTIKELIRLSIWRHPGCADCRILQPFREQSNAKPGARGVRDVASAIITYEQIQ